MKVVALSALLFVSSACGPTDGMQQSEQLAQQSAFLVNDLLSDAPLRVAHHGVRRVEIHYPADGSTGSDVQHVVYRESIVTDGQGRFDVQPLEIERGAADTLLQTLRLHAGFAFRYGGFRVRDLDLFLDNYALLETGHDVVVAGRAASEFRVKSVLDERSYTAAVDLATGLVLRYREESADGALLSAMEYLAYEAEPDLTGVFFREPANLEVELDPRGDLSTALGFEPLFPSAIPEGYALRGMASVMDVQDHRWLKLTYSDGVESLFFLSSPTTPEPVGRTGDRVLVFEAGPFTAADGTLGAERMIAVGKVPEASLLGMIRSAIPK